MFRTKSYDVLARIELAFDLADIDPDPDLAARIWERVCVTRALVNDWDKALGESGEADVNILLSYPGKRVVVTIPSVSPDIDRERALREVRLVLDRAREAVTV